MIKPDQKGFIAQLFLFLLLLAGLGVGIYLVQTRTGWFSKAAPVIPQKPETSFELEVQGDTAEPFADTPVKLTGVGVGTKFRVDVWARSDIDPANLFVAKIKFPTDLLQVVEINKRGANSFVNQWIADPSFDNDSGDISIIGGVNAPGLLTAESQVYTAQKGNVKGISTGSIPAFDTQTIYLRPDGTRRETVTAYGKYWNWDNPPGGGWNPVGAMGGNLTTVDRYTNSGPCSGQSPCKFDTQIVYYQSNGTRRETVTAYGKYWNWDETSPGQWQALSSNGGNLVSVDRYASGPCQGVSVCTFDTQTIYLRPDGTRRETVTAYGKYWNWDNPPGGGWNPLSSNGGTLASVDRYASGPCQGQSTCIFDTQTVYYQSNGTRRETVTAYGKYWNWDEVSAGNWKPLDSNGGELAAVDRYGKIVPPVKLIPIPTTNPPVLSTNPPTPAPVTTITMCNGQTKTWAEIDSELRGADYPGPFDHSQSEIAAYNRAACPNSIPGNSSTQTCLGPRTWDDIDNGLKKANYGGPLDHSQGELDAFNRAACPSPTPASQPTLMVPRLMASIIFETKKAGTAEIEVTDGSQILRNSDSTNIISAKKGLKLPILGSLVSAPVGGGGGELVCTNIAAALPLGKMPSGEDSYVVTGAKSVQLGVNASPLAKITWKQLSSFALSSLNSNPTTMTVVSDGTYEVGATANWENPSATATCPNISITFQAAPVNTPAPAASVPPQSLRHDGDVNSDGKFNLVDMSRLLSQFGQTAQSEADLNGDGKVNSMDVLKLRSILVQKGVLKGG